MSLDLVPVELFTVDVSSDGRQAVLVLRGELDLCTRPRFAAALAWAEDGYMRIVLDLTDLEFIDAGSIGLIHRARNLGRMRGTELVLRSAKPLVYRVLQLTNLADALAEHEEVPTFGFPSAPRPSEIAL